MRALADRCVLAYDRVFHDRAVADDGAGHQHAVEHLCALADAHGRGHERYLLMRELSEHKVEFSKRLVFAMASFCFVLVGIPLGIKAQRKESTIGMAIALAVSLGYYLIVILMLSLHKSFTIHPEYLIWLAVVVCFGLASRLIPKNL